MNGIWHFLTNERYITYQTGFSFGRLGHAQGWYLGVPWVLGAKNFFPEILSDLVCSYLHELHMQRHNVLGPHLLGPWGGVKNLIF